MSDHELALSKPMQQILLQTAGLVFTDDGVELQLVALGGSRTIEAVVFGNLPLLSVGPPSC